MSKIKERGGCHRNVVDMANTRCIGIRLKERRYHAIWLTGIDIQHVERQDYKILLTGTFPTIALVL